MNPELKHTLDKDMVTGQITPDEYMEAIKVHFSSETHPINASGDDPSMARKIRSRSKLGSSLLVFLIPVVLSVKYPSQRLPPGSYAEPQAVPAVSTPSTSEQVASSEVVSSAPDPAPQVTLRDIYEGRAQLQSVPSQPPQQEMAPHDAFMLGQIVTALNMQEQAMAQQREYERQMSQVRQMHGQQAEQRIQENGRRFAGLMQQSPVQPRQSSPPAWSPQPAPSANPSQVACQYECPHCHRVQTYAFRLAIPPICTQDSHTMNLRR